MLIDFYMLDSAHMLLVLCTFCLGTACVPLVYLLLAYFALSGFFFTNYPTQAHATPITQSLCLGVLDKAREVKGTHSAPQQNVHTRGSMCALCSLIE